jgi:hypothetical protein
MLGAAAAFLVVVVAVMAVEMTIAILATIVTIYGNDDVFVFESSKYYINSYSCVIVYDLRLTTSSSIIDNDERFSTSDRRHGRISHHKLRRIHA